MRRFQLPRAASLAATLLTTVLVCSAPGARAQDAKPKPGDGDSTTELSEAQAEAIELVKLAEPMVWRGKYFDAAKRLNEALKADPTLERAAWLLGHALRDQGKGEEALEVLNGYPKSADAHVLAAEILVDAGKIEEADQRLDAALAVDAAHVNAIGAKGHVAELLGNVDAAIEHFRKANSAWAKAKGKDSYETLIAVGRARLGLFRLSEEYRVSLKSAMDRFHEAKKLDDRRAHALVEAGNLFLRNYQDVDAKAYFRDALERNPHYAPAIDGKAQQLMFRWDDQQATAEWKRALRENARYVPALVALAQIALGDADLKLARKYLATAEKVNSEHAEVRAVRAAALYVDGDTKAFEAEVAKSKGPALGTLFRLLAAVLEEQRRFAEALTMAERAVKADPNDWDAHFIAGRNAANLGDDEKADAHLRKADEGDIFANVHRVNFLTLFDKMQKFPLHRDGLFVVKLPPAEENAYLPLLVPTLHWSIDLLQKKWDFEMEAPLYVSVFDSQNDFAVRTIGLPGFPALGACFGRVVTLDSPRVCPPGPFGWRATLHHELAHVITLQLSKGRVPRWLTEGLSVYEERKISPMWNREMERELIDAIASDEVLTLEKVNNAFRGPRVMYAYYQGGLMCEFIERDWGFPKLREMVRLYGENLNTTAVVRQVLEVEPEEFDRRFLAYVKEYVKDIRLLPRISSGKLKKLKRHLRKNKDDIDAWFLRAAAHAVRGQATDALAAVQHMKRIDAKDPRASAIQAMIAWSKRRPDRAVTFAEEAIAAGYELYSLRVRLGAHYASEKVGDFEKAKAHLKKGIELFPQDPNPGGARGALIDLLLGEGDTGLDEAMRLLREHTLVAEDDYPARLKLASFHRAADRKDAELELLLEVRDVVPLPFRASAPVKWTRQQAVDLNERIGELLLAKKDNQGAELAYRMAVEIAVMNNGTDEDRPLDDGVRSDLLTQHATALRALGRTEEAVRQLKSALELDDGNDEARELLELLSQ